MPKHPEGRDRAFGRRLAALRRAAGYSQRGLAEELGTTQRMIAYYEWQGSRPPAHLLPALADALGVTTDQLLGIEPPRPAKINRHLLRKLQQIDELPPRAKAAILEHIDALLEKYRRR